jgi:hypothetical protein
VSTPDETYRTTMRVQTPEHGPATLIVTRQGSRTWLTLDGSIRTTAVLTDQQLNELTSKLRTSADPAGGSGGCCGATRLARPGAAGVARGVPGSDLDESGI